MNDVSYLIKLKMNILYFDDKELWSPTLDDMLEAITESETYTISVQKRV